MSTGTKREIGDRAEELVVHFLENAGLNIIEKNLRLGYVELDVVALDESDTAEVLCFIEVKYRRGQGFGGALAAVTAQKQKRLHKAAARYLAKKYESVSLAPRCRFDVVTVEGSLEKPLITHHKQAFEVQS